MAKTVKCTQSVMKNCKWSFRYNAANSACCDYIGKTGHSRGCPPEACDKFEQRKKAMK